jgi:glycosyltransferase involved in cell wall biosynthesis
MRVTFVMTHPIQYFAPTFKELEKDPDWNIVVLFDSLLGVDAQIQPGFNRAVTWNTPILSEYEWSHAGHRRDVGIVGKLAARARLATMVKRTRPDVVVVAGYTNITSWTGLFAARMSRVPVAIISDSFGARFHREGIRGRLARRLSRWAYRRFDGVLALSSRSYIHVNGLVSGSGTTAVERVRHAVDVSHFAGNQVHPKRRERRLRVGYAGKLVQWKRVELLLRAVVDNDVEVQIAGSGPLEADLRSLAASLNLSDRITFLGFVNQSEMPKFYEAIDVLVLPSDRETFGIVVLEAMSAGVVPIVSSACGCANDVVVHNVTGLVFEAGSVEGLSDAIEAISDEDARLSIAQRALVRAKEQHTPDLQAADFRRVTARLVDRSRRDQPSR